MKLPHILLTALVACLGPIATASAALNIVATTSDLGALARTVGGDAVSVTILARATEDPHFVDARPGFLRALNKASLLIEGGAELESGWLPPLVNNARNAKILPGGAGRFSAAENLPSALHDVPKSLDRSQGDVHPTGNPHFLLDPANAVNVAQALAERLAQIDSANATAYRQRAAKFATDTKAKLAVWRQRLAPWRGASVVTYHHSFDYFLAAFELKLADTIEPKPGVEPSASHLVSLVARMKNNDVKLIFAEPNRPTRTCERVAAESGAKLLRLPLMPGGVAGTDDYLAFIEFNVTAIEKALKRN
jgi:ABC-type Zn uptake system ZnuABC Zn-binding protein ZnuA